MTEAEDADERRHTRILAVLGSLTVLSAIGASCWSGLVVVAAWLWAALSWMSAGGVFDPELIQWYHDMAATGLVWGFALALAPWVVLGILVPPIWVVAIWWMRTRARSAHQSH